MALQNYSVQSMNDFMGKAYYIPNYQREYSWEANEIADFWDDLHSTMEQNLDDHFFGQIVVHVDEEEKRKYIIDGQQRTITSMIFMRTLQLFLERISEENGSEYKSASKWAFYISTQHLGPYDEEEKSPHLTLNETDNDYYVNNILVGTPSVKKEKKKSWDRMRFAFHYFYQQLDENYPENGSAQEKYNYLKAYYDCFTQAFKVMYIEATKLEEAFIIFETLNARGKDLETADLLKNFIFKASNNINHSQKQWEKMISDLDGIDPTKYIRHYWNSYEKFAREKELYRKISKTINSPRKSNDFLDNLAKMASCYHDLANPENNIEFTDSDLLDSLNSIKNLKAKSFYPVILAMKQSSQNYSEVDIRKVVQAIEVYIFRNFTICGRVANHAEVFFADVATQVFEEKLVGTQAIISAIRKGMVSDQEFEDRFIDWKGKPSNKDTIRYIFRKIHAYLDPSHELNTNNSEVHIEHIMPDDNSKWGVPEEEHEEYLWRLGNLALLDGKFNASISNDVFDIKRPTYLKSKIEPNRDIGMCGNWDSSSIVERQKQLAKYALIIWK